MTPDQELEVANASMSATLSLNMVVQFLQIMWYTRELMGEEEADKLAKKLNPVIESVMETLDKQMENYIRKYGES
jgi:hypothetical protein